jgi:hypothetical protein
MSFCLCSCSKNNQEFASQAEITDPFLDNSQSVQKIISLGSFIIKSDISEEITYSGDSICINEHIKVTEADIKFGFITFINGIPQINSNTNSILTRISIKEDEEDILPLIITPNCGKQGEKHRMDILSMFYPDFVPEEDKFQFGNYQHAMAAKPIIINYEKSSEEKEIKIDTVKTTRYPTDEENTKYNLLESSVDIFELNQDGNRDYFTLNNNGVKFDLKVYAANSETYRISLFKNHEPVKINSFDVIDVILIKGNVSEISIELDDAKAGDFIYAFAVPITNDLLSPVKTQSMKIMKEDFTIQSDNSVSQEDQDPKSNLAENYSNLSLLSADENYTYFNGYDDKNNYIFCIDKNKNVVNTSKALDIGGVDHFKILSDGFGFVGLDMGEAVCYITLDKKFEVTACYDLKDIGMEKPSLITNCFDINKHKIIFINDNDEISIYDFNTKETTIVSKIEKIDSTYVSIHKIRFLSENKASFIAQNISDNEKFFIGVVDLSNGNIEFKQSTDISGTIYCAEETACWFSQRKDTNEISDGIIHFYYDNEFHELNCENKNESQHVFLSNDGEKVATYIVDETGIEVSVYNIHSEKKIFKKHIELTGNINPYNTQIYIFSDKLYIYNPTGNDVFEVYNLEG